jgi:hypothetical protein
MKTSRILLNFLLICQNFQNQKLKSQIRIFQLYYLFSTLMLNLKIYYNINIHLQVAYQEITTKPIVT